MLESITLKNFQKHENLVIEFDPGVTTLIGTSDAGKSAAIRALTWIAQNKLRGDQFIRHGTKSAEVALNASGAKIERIRGKSNEYKLDGETYKAVSSTVPEDVADVLQVNTINFQQQHDTPFLFSATPGQVATALNAVVDLSIIDTTLKHINTEHAKARNRVEVFDEEKENNEKILETLEAVKEIDEELSELENDLKEIEGIEKELQQITELGKFIKEKTADIEDIETIQNEFVDVVGMHDIIISTREEINTLEDIFDDLDACEVDFDFYSFFKLTQDYEDVIEARRLYNELGKALNSAEIYCDDVTRLIFQIEEIESTLGVCPTCGK